MSETTIDRLEADLRDAIADADERANVEGSERYWITVRDALSDGSYDDDPNGQSRT